jgi:hypothetical protein
MKNQRWTFVVGMAAAALIGVVFTGAPSPRVANASCSVPWLCFNNGLRCRSPDLLACVPGGNGCVMGPGPCPNCSPRCAEN